MKENFKISNKFKFCSFSAELLNFLLQILLRKLNQNFQLITYINFLLKIY